MSKDEVLKTLPNKNCGLCGFKSCEAFAEIVTKDPASVKRCIYTNDAKISSKEEFKEITWKDNLGREYDFILDKFPNEVGPRETIILFNPTNVEKLKIKKGDVCYGRPAWISCGCPVTHVGIVVDEPDYFNGTLVWCIVGPLLARQKGINIGYYNTTAYEGVIKHTKKEIRIGERYYFLPRYCMLQWRHCGLVNSITKLKDGLQVRIEGLFIG